MLKMSVSPLAIRNSNMPNSTPFKVEIKISSSNSLSVARRRSVPPPPVGRTGGRAGATSARAIHLATGRQHCIGSVEARDDAPAPPGLLLVERLLVAALAE